MTEPPAEAPKPSDDFATGPVDLWAKFEPPPLPTDLLPTVIKEYAIDQSRLMGSDPSGFAMTALAVCAAAIPDRIQLQPKKYDKRWKESARIWVGLIGNPSTMKSPMMRDGSYPIRRLDIALYKTYAEANDKYEALTKEEKKTATRPQKTRLMIEDTTFEAAQEVLRDSPDGVLCYQDELSGWFGGMDKYSGHRGGMKDRGFWLQAYNGGSAAFDRISRGSGVIPNLSVSMLGGIQPEVIRKLAAETIDDGLLQRLIPIILRPSEMGKDEPTSQSVDRYADLVERLHQIKEPFDGPVFDDGALKIRLELEKRHYDLMACESINKKLAAHIGKYNGLFARLCLLWHCIESSGEVQARITEATARRVADFLHGFLLPHAISFYVGMLGLSDEHDRLTAVAGYILARKLEKITSRDVQRGDRTMRGLHKQDTENVFHQLEAFGWVNRMAGRRPSDPPQWIVNTDVHRMFADRAAKEAERRQRDRAIIAEVLGVSRKRPGTGAEVGGQ
jgi:hypothetical protein